MGHHHTNLLSSPETSLWSSTNPSLCFLSVDSVVTSSTTSLSTEALERSPARSSQRVGVLDHRIDVLLLAPVLRLKREWSLALTCASACCWLCSFLACSWLCSCLACSWLCSCLACSWLCSCSFFSPSSSKLSILPKLLASVGAVFAPRLQRRCVWHLRTLRSSAPRSRSSTCCAWTGGLQHHTLPSSARCAVRMCFQSSSALGRHSFPSNYNTACLLVCSPHLTIALDSTGNDRQHRQVW